MTSLDTGLRHRLRRIVQQVETQHRHLQPIREELCLACERGRTPAASAACKRYREAISAHFALEQQMFFPALHGLHPERRDELEELDREHTGLLEQLDELVELCGSGELAAAKTSIGQLTDALAAHEQEEEALVRLLSR